VTREPYLELEVMRIPGDAEDMEVGVELTLKGPGEYPVDDVADIAYSCDGGGRSVVARAKGSTYLFKLITSSRVVLL
jgi:rhodanese-related sulfurtransferase